MARKQEYIRVRIETIEEYIAMLMAQKVIGYHYNGALDLAEYLNVPLDKHAIELRAEEYKRMMAEYAKK